MKSVLCHDDDNNCSNRPQLLKNKNRILQLDKKKLASMKKINQTW